MDSGRSTSDQQSTLWNSIAGNAWVELQDVIELTFEPFEKLLVDAVSAASASCVLDIGCGMGSTTLAVARCLGTNGSCVGLDISGPMIAAARARIERGRNSVTFVEDDAETHVFEPGSFDMIISRFGVMFFGDFVRAFANLRHAARNGAHLRFIAWRSAGENPFMTTAERAAAPLVTNLPAREPDAPGQFAFADQSRVQRILNQSGWTDIAIKPIDVACHFPEKELVRYFTRLGPLGRIFDRTDPTIRSALVATVTDAFEPYVHGGEVRFTAACWDVSARATQPSTSTQYRPSIDLVST
jgi:SAM-dependent methyltransferase